MGKATRESYGMASLELGSENEKIVVLDADLSKSTKTSEFKNKFSDRFFNVGIAEQNLMGMAAGLSNVGYIPFASTFAVFATGRAFEIIRNSICYPKMNVKIAATHAGITVGEDGGSHQSVEDIALMNSLPNMTVIVPADHRETMQAIKAAANYEGPVYLRLGRCNTQDIFN
ncbi:transketolase family protein, partial [Clostridium perfringens]|nr:transketolase family protein [Clostridium perfringens]